MQPNSQPHQALAPASGTHMAVATALFQLLPKNLMSFATGAVVRWRWPTPLATVFCRMFASVFKLNMAEAELPLTSFKTIEDVFTRALKPGARPVEGPVCSPADGILARSEPAQAGQAVQAKGLTYDLKTLTFGDQPAPAGVDFAWYQLVYLAPHNYHRVHSPVAGKVTCLRHLPGQLWPVALAFTARVPRLYTRNERLVFDVALAGGGRAWVVMVGALNVGRMVTPLDPQLITNSFARQFGPASVERPLTPPRPVALGEELGTFMLGSTVVVIFDREAMTRIRLVQIAENRPILMGQSLMH